MLNLTTPLKAHYFLSQTDSYLNQPTLNISKHLFRCVLGSMTFSSCQICTTMQVMSCKHLQQCYSCRLHSEGKKAFAQSSNDQRACCFVIYPCFRTHRRCFKEGLDCEAVVFKKFSLTLETAQLNNQPPHVCCSLFLCRCHYLIACYETHQSISFDRVAVNFEQSFQSLKRAARLRYQISYKD